MKRISVPIITTELCSYGCGSLAKFKNGCGKLMCCTRTNSCPAIKEKNRQGCKSAYSNGKRKSQKELYESLPQSVKDAMAWSRGKFPKTTFSYGKAGQNHKKYLIQERGASCEFCKLSTWMDMPITLELEHIDGDNKNNVKENLKLLCPNCHSYTPTWRGRNINSGKNKVSDEELLTAYNSCNNIRQALLKVGLSAKGGNYNRLKNLIARMMKSVDIQDLSKI